MELIRFPSTRKPLDPAAGASVILSFEEGLRRRRRALAEKYKAETKEGNAIDVWAARHTLIDHLYRYPYYANSEADKQMLEADLLPLYEDFDEELFLLGTRAVRIFHAPVCSEQYDSAMLDVQDMLLAGRHRKLAYYLMMNGHCRISDWAPAERIVEFAHTAAAINASRKEYYQTGLQLCAAYQLEIPYQLFFSNAQAKFPGAFRGVETMERMLGKILGEATPVIPFRNE